MGLGNRNGCAGRLCYGTDAVTRHRIAAQATCDLGDQAGQALALYELGVVRHLTSDYQDAVGTLEAALAIYRVLGDKLGQANTLNYLAAAQRQAGDYARTNAPRAGARPSVDWRTGQKMTKAGIGRRGGTC